MAAVRIVESAILVVLGFAHLAASFNASDKNQPKIVLASGLLGILALALGYVIWL